MARLLPKRLCVFIFNRLSNHYCGTLIMCSCTKLCSSIANYLDSRYCELDFCLQRSTFNRVYDSKKMPVEVYFLISNHNLR